MGLTCSTLYRSQNTFLTLCLETGNPLYTPAQTLRRECSRILQEAACKEIVDTRIQAYKRLNTRRQAAEVRQAHQIAIPLDRHPTHHANRGWKKVQKASHDTHVDGVVTRAPWLLGAG